MPDRDIGPENLATRFLMTPPKITQHLDVRLLAQFLIVCDTSKMTLAAKRLGLSPSAVSQIVHRLERELDIVLFERGPRGIRLTPAGALLRSYARDITEREQDVLQALEPYRDRLFPKIRIHIVTSIASYIMPAFVRELRPVVGQIELRSGRLASTVKDFLVEQVDILISSESLDDITTVESHHICREELIALVPRSVEPELRNLDYLCENVPLIRTQTGSHSDEEISGYLHRRGLNPPRAIECSTPAPAIELIAQDIGWTITSPLTISRFPGLDARTAIVSLPAAPLRETYLVATSGRLLSLPSDLTRLAQRTLREEIDGWHGTENELLLQKVSIP